MRSAIFFLFAFPLLIEGQIILPEFMSPDREEGGRVPKALPEDYSHEEEGAGENKSSRSTNKRDLKREESELQQMQMRMQSNRIEFNELKDQPPEPGVNIEEIEALYLSGPERVLLEVQTSTGEKVQGIVRNRTILVKTPVGNLPLRLHEISSGRRDEDSDTFRLELQNKDLVNGSLSTLFLDIMFPNGSRRMVKGGEIRQIRRLDAPE